MSNSLWVSTRKGLLRFERRGTAWILTATSFLGQNVTLALPDPRDGAVYAALNLGHFGVKLHRSHNGGTTWEELPMPAYPEGEQLVTGDGKPPVPANLKMIWSLEPGSSAQPGRLWCGTLPGGLFRSDDSGATWQLMRGLWDHPDRVKWFGGGYDTPGIHSICVDPRNDRRIQVGVSCGGAWTSEDDGVTWRCTATGMFAEYMPPELRGEPVIQDPHRMVASFARRTVPKVGAKFPTFPLRCSALRSPSIRATPTRRGSSRRLRTKPARRWMAAWSSRGRAMAARHLRSCLRVCQAVIALTSCIATRSTSTRRAIASRWVRRRAIFGSAKMAATSGRQSQATCRRFTRCGLREY